MEKLKLQDAVEEANRFIHTANWALIRLAGEPTLEITGCKETGATRRASLDLTRILADLRRVSR